MAPIRLMLVTDSTLVAPAALADVVERAVVGGVDAVCLREKVLAEAELIRLGRSLRAVTRGHARLLVNGSCAVAVACAADGLHVPEAMPRPPCDGLPVGRSVHGVEAAQAAGEEGAAYLLLGTVFASRSHPGGAAGGLTLVREVRRHTHLPLIAIGGITDQNAAQVIEIGRAHV